MIDVHAGAGKQRACPLIADVEAPGHGFHRRIGVDQIGQGLVAVAEHQGRRRLDALLPRLRIVDCLAQHGDQTGLAGTVQPEQHDTVALADELPAGPEEGRSIRRADLGIVERHQHLGVGAAIGQPDDTGRTLHMGRPGGVLQPLCPLLQLLGLDHQQVAA